MVKRDATLSIVKTTVKSLLMEYVQGLPRVKRLALQSIIARSEPSGVIGRKQEANYVERLASRATYEFETSHLNSGASGREAMITEAWTTEAAAWARGEIDDQIQRTSMFHRARTSRPSSNLGHEKTRAPNSFRPSSNLAPEKTRARTMPQTRVHSAGGTPLKRRLSSSQSETSKLNSIYSNQRQVPKSPCTTGFGPRKVTASRDPRLREEAPKDPKREDCIERVQNIVESWHCQARSVAASCGCDSFLELVDFYKLAVHEIIAARYDVSAMTLGELNDFATSFAESCTNAMPQEEGATLDVAYAMIENAMGLRLGSRKHLWEETWEALGCNAFCAQPRIDPNTEDVPMGSEKEACDQDESAKNSNTSMSATEERSTEKASTITENENNGFKESASNDASITQDGLINPKVLPDHPNPPANKKKPMKRRAN